ncbi:30S ribosomal protein S17 [Candidatus Berkelbacteria bacterium CG_4_8_14_3_um_filter_33_6]|uniref:30S ribosomal protein S17 n=1 Tax=Candidatus Berkelbacteria bacterium CG_4_10_14_0_2_um_filter_35_9_33_12 TaxID=1974499 RepID=A0A2M7W4L3_9BACT|nr:MAG: 30S ribosomal protein S17 [Candidatus Berkelbacteria bacterium CG23_combo_of_CG06-09_8_20_14_all_33_15]PIS08125.1 MAG: 30S ribosomal protein S17 [Candidatus Berkelbacteria bacterium CG10_big_fil_rev_8_21_14_0_10_33_10]PIX31283.1 MAG: 30S ribosomal protein S17 [Candidatus Berkelbacteria bacterium CG_4_8_14_3_um_filter_33_6]PIZ28437.1 MAG: 30S ribosomal protein S17 [Candidatus Berkelbacteria bacterium CG_4_10_14_0_8_um_filter_35_9_33_8]PJA20758.1 MAG: 30S ribosomal protein S17 [Candidatus
MKKINGTITKIIDQRTYKVQTLRRKKHPLYSKYYSITKNYLVDKGEINKNLEIGKKVQFVDCRPISKRKKWKLI